MNEYCAQLAETWMIVDGNIQNQALVDSPINRPSTDHVNGRS